MKITILITVLLIITAGCGSSSNSNSNSNNNSNTSKATPLVEPPNNEPDGGPCTFANSTGILTVKELRNLPVKEDRSGPDKFFTVVFDYQADGDQAPVYLKNFHGKMEFHNTETIPTNLKVGDSFPTRVKYQTIGACAPGPYMLDFDAMVVY